MQLSLESLLPISVILKHIIEDITIHGRNKKNISFRNFLLYNSCVEGNEYQLQMYIKR